MPCDYSKYPKNWKSEIRPAVLKRANNCCEKCGVPNHAIGWRDKDGMFNLIEPTMQGETDGFDAEAAGKRIIEIVLTISHTDHDITNNDYSNLKALCQRCHLRHDKEFHKANSRATNEKKKGLQKLF